MSSTIITLLITAGGLILSLVTQAWFRAVSQGETRQTILGLSGNVAKLIDWNDDRLKFQAGTNEFITAQRETNRRSGERIDGIDGRLNQMQGREDGRNRER